MYLSIDTSSDTLSIALVDEHRQGITLNSKSSYRHADYLVSFIDALFKIRNVCWKDIEGIIIGSGPGSFTGLRIGFSCVKAFMMTLKKPVWSLSSFYAVFYKYKDTYPRLCCVKNAMKGNVYVGDFNPARNGVKASVRLISYKDFLKTVSLKKDFLFAGDSFMFRGDILRYNTQAQIVPANDTPDAGLLAQAALQLFPHKKLLKPEQLKPLYFYPESCQIRKK